MAVTGFVVYPNSNYSNIYDDLGKGGQLFLNLMKSGLIVSQLIAGLKFL